MFRARNPGILIVVLTSLLVTPAHATEPPSFERLGRDYDDTIRPILKLFCLNCHSTTKRKGDLDLEALANIADFRRDPQVWQKIAEALDSGEMPPKGSPPPPATERIELRRWVASALAAWTGDPGPVVIRRLTNVEYNNTVRDLTEINLEPAREFPADAAAGEGFTNVSDALVMSPAMLDKYLAAAKGIAAHAVLLPAGFRFSVKTTRPDWTEEILDEIRQIYHRYTDPSGSTQVKLQGLVWDAKAGGRIPLESYLAATIAHRDDVTGRKTIAAITAENHLSARYLQTLWDLFNGPARSPLLEPLRVHWKSARSGDVPRLAAEIRRWQTALSSFRSVGHFKPWLETVNPIEESHTFRLKIAPAASASEVLVSLVTRDAGDGRAGDLVEWKQPRLEAPGRPPLLLRDLRVGLQVLMAKRRTLKDAGRYLAAADSARDGQAGVDCAVLAKDHKLDSPMLAACLDLLGIAGSDTKATIESLFTERMESSGGHDFLKGWGSPGTPSVIANSSDREVRIPGIVKPHSIAVHPSPTDLVGVGWRSSMTGLARIEARVVHAHPECGNGITWVLELRRGSERRRLVAGEVDRGRTARIDPVEKLSVRAGDLVCLLVGPRGDHSCDLTEVDLTITDLTANRGRWVLSRDVSDDLLAWIPHAHSLGHREVWHFYHEKQTGEGSGPMASIFAGSLLDRWRNAPEQAERERIAGRIERLFGDGPDAGTSQPDRLMYRQLTSLGGPLLGRIDAGQLARRVVPNEPEKAETDGPSLVFGLPRTMFGKPPLDHEADPSSLVLQAPSVLEIRLPADFAAGRELVVDASLDRNDGALGSVQVQVLVDQSPGKESLLPELTIMVRNGSAAKQRVESWFNDFPRIFPAALCYSQIVPVDEVVTLALYHREEEHLARLMLDEPERRRLDRLWDELSYVSQEALKVEVGYAQFMEYTTQDSDPKLFKPLRQPILERAAALRRRLVDTEPKHLDALLESAGRAYRRPLAEREHSELRALYRKLRAQDLDHDGAFRLVLARVLVAPSFLYRAEQSADGAAPQPVTEWELASRLSYFLWSSQPDEELRRCAARGTLHDPDVMEKQVQWMLADPKIGALATEFACQWLDVRGFDRHNEKREQVFPQFTGLREAMYEEAVRFFVDLFQRDGSLLEVIDTDHTFLNEPLARHYGISDVIGPEWRRVDGIKVKGRGGILGCLRCSPSNREPRAPAPSSAATGCSRCSWARSCPGRPRTCLNCPKASSIPTGSRCVRLPRSIAAPSRAPDATTGSTPSVSRWRLLMRLAAAARPTWRDARSIRA